MVQRCLRSQLSLWYWLHAFLLLVSAKNREVTTAPPCPYDFTVYVYDLSPDLSPLRLAEEARRNRTFHVCQKCIFEQFALEYVLVDFFTQFCGRTYNPDEADFFYLPVVRDVDYRVAMQRGGGKGRDPSPMENVLIEALEKNNTEPWKAYLNVTDRYWRRYNGADHIIAMPAPVTNLRHQSSMRGHFHYVRIAARLLTDC